MDRHAAYTFLELAFGVNIVWSTFDGVRKKTTNNLLRLSENLCAGVNTLESKDTRPETLERFGKLKTLVGGIGGTHKRIQDILCACARGGAVICALAIPPILYFNGFGRFPRLRVWYGVLMLPLVIYFLISWLLLLLFWCRVNWETRTYRQFISKYEGKPGGIIEQIDSAVDATAIPQEEPAPPNSSDE